MEFHPSRSSHIAKPHTKTDNKLFKNSFTNYPRCRIRQIVETIKTYSHSFIPPLLLRCPCLSLSFTAFSRLHFHFAFFFFIYFTGQRSHSNVCKMRSVHSWTREEKFEIKFGILVSFHIFIRAWLGVSEEATTPLISNEQHMILGCILLSIFQRVVITMVGERRANEKWRKHRDESKGG